MSLAARLVHTAMARKNGDSPESPFFHPSHGSAK
jgi:hypothetical protein